MNASAQIAPSGKAMNLATSLYLDVVRFSAALVVLLAHYSSGRLSGGLFWQLQGYGYDAVMTFFVLSGLVIAYATDEKDATPRLYYLSRLSRLYSVIVPAIIVTLVADSIGTRVAPHLYTAHWGYADSYPLLRVFGAITFTSYAWYNTFQLFSNGPYWSLPFEFSYYIFFGVVHFLRGRMRWIAALTVMAIAGPRILLMLPIWLMGVAAYRIMQRARLSRTQGVVLWLGSIACLVLVLALRVSWLDFPLPDQFPTAGPNNSEWRPQVDAREFLIGICFMFNFVGFKFTGDTFMPVLMPFKTLIRWTAGMTFSLYLFHMPLLQVYAAISPWPNATWIGRIYLLLAVLVTTVLLSYASERRRSDWRAWISRLIPDAELPAPAAKLRSQAAPHQ